MKKIVILFCLLLIFTFSFAIKPSKDLIGRKVYATEDCYLISKTGLFNMRFYCEARSEFTVTKIKSKYVLMNLAGKKLKEYQAKGGDEFLVKANNNIFVENFVDEEGWNDYKENKISEYLIKWPELNREKAEGIFDSKIWLEMTLEQAIESIGKNVWNTSESIREDIRIVILEVGSISKYKADIARRTYDPISRAATRPFVSDEEILGKIVMNLVFENRKLKEIQRF